MSECEEHQHLPAILANRIHVNYSKEIGNLKSIRAELTNPFTPNETNHAETRSTALLHPCPQCDKYHSTQLHAKRSSIRVQQIWCLDVGQGTPENYRRRNIPGAALRAVDGRERELNRISVQGWRGGVMTTGRRDVMNMLDWIPCYLSNFNLWLTRGKSDR